MTTIAHGGQQVHVRCYRGESKSIVVTVTDPDGGTVNITAVTALVWDSAGVTALTLTVGAGVTLGASGTSQTVTIAFTGAQLTLTGAYQWSVKTTEAAVVFFPVTPSEFIIEEGVP